MTCPAVSDFSPCVLQVRHPGAHQTEGGREWGEGFDAYELYIPGLRLVSEANARENRWVKAARIKAQRQLVTKALDAYVGPRVLVAIGSRSEIEPLDVTITRVAPRGLDDDNLAGACKAVRDATAKALGVDDRKRERVRYITAESSGGAKVYGARIRIEVRQ